MVQRFFFIIILVSTLVPSHQEGEQSVEYDYDDDYYDDHQLPGDSTEIQETKDITSVPVQTSKGTQVKDFNIHKVKRDREELTTEKPVGKYEVTELVNDIPDVSTSRVPIITNFTLNRPLNLAGVPNNETNNVGANAKDDGDEIINSILIPDKNKVSNTNEKEITTGSISKVNTNKNNNDDFSDFNPKGSFEEDFDKEFGSNEDNFQVENEPKPSKSFRDHFHSFRKCIANEFKSVVDKHKDGIHDSFRKIVNGPVSFFSKLHRKSADLAKRFHKAVSRHPFHDHDEDIDFHGVDHEYGID